MEYQPGKCNIGRREQRKRYFLGSSGFTAAGILVILQHFNYLSTAPGSVLPVLLFVGFNGFIQGRLNFCAGYGLLGKENSDDSQPEATPENSRLQDLLGAAKIQLYALFGTLLVYGLLTFTAF
jgi:hypothetical protein